MVGRRGRVDRTLPAAAAREGNGGAQGEAAGGDGPGVRSEHFGGGGVHAQEEGSVQRAGPAGPGGAAPPRGHRRGADVGAHPQGQRGAGGLRGCAAEPHPGGGGGGGARCGAAGQEGRIRPLWGGGRRCAAPPPQPPAAVRRGFGPPPAAHVPPGPPRHGGGGERCAGAARGGGGGGRPRSAQPGTAPPPPGGRVSEP